MKNDTAMMQTSERCKLDVEAELWAVSKKRIVITFYLMQNTLLLLRRLFLSPFMDDSDDSN
jgi:hypothetical protein